MFDGILKYLAMFLGVYTAMMYACFKGHEKIEEAAKEESKNTTFWGDVKKILRRTKNGIRTIKDAFVAIGLGAVVFIVDYTVSSAPIGFVWLYFVAMIVIFGGIAYMWFMHGVRWQQLFIAVIVVIPMVTLMEAVTNRIAVACFTVNGWSKFFRDDLAIILAALVLVYCISNRCKCNFMSYKKEAAKKKKEAAKKKEEAAKKKEEAAKKKEEAESAEAEAEEYLAKAKMWRVISVAIWPIVAVLVIIFLSTQ